MGKGRGAGGVVGGGGGVGGESGAGGSRVRKKHVQLTSADAVGRARRDAFEKRELEGLKETMSYAEWKKMSSAKHRKKLRKLAGRERRTAVLREEAEREVRAAEASIPSLSGALPIGARHRFDPSLLGRGLILSQGGLVVRRSPGVNVASFAVFGDPAASGLSRYALRIEGVRNSVYIGVARMPLDPPECFARVLQTSAWMLADSGKAYLTQQGTPRTPLSERVVPMPDGGVKEEVEIPMIGVMTRWSKHKMRQHRYAFRPGSVVQMTFDRPKETLSFCVDGREWFTLGGVSRNARPFVNLFAPNDGASILRAEDGPSLSA